METNTKMESKLIQNKVYTITKKIAKQGKQAVILIPKLLSEALKPGTIAKLTIEVLEGTTN